MPYITENDRRIIDLTLLGWMGEKKFDLVTLKDLFEGLFACDEPPRPGELNYIITTLIHEYIKRKGLSYTTLNDVLGVLSGVDLELKRCVIAPYEDKKRRENGCISELDNLRTG